FRSELLADFRIPKPPECSQGAQRAVFCAVRVADFLAEGAGWGASPGRGGELGCQARQVLKKFVRLASVFPSPPFRSSDFAGPRRSRLYGFHTGTRSLSNRKGRGRRRGGREREPRRAGEASPKPPPKPPPKPRSGLCPELLADFRIPKPPGCSQGRRGQFSVQSDNRFSGRGGGVGSLPRAWRRVGVALAQQVLKKMCEIGVGFSSPPF